MPGPARGTAMIVVGDMSGASTFHREGRNADGWSITNRAGATAKAILTDRMLTGIIAGSDTMPTIGVFTLTMHGSMAGSAAGSVRGTCGYWAAETENASGSTAFTSELLISTTRMSMTGIWAATALLSVTIPIMWDGIWFITRGWGPTFMLRSWADR